MPNAGNWIALNCFRNEQLASGSSIAIGNGDFAVSSGVFQVAEVCRVDREPTKYQ